ELDLDAKMWVLPGARSKNAQAHSVPLSEPVLAILKSLPRVHGKAGLVFTRNGLAPVAGFARAKERLDAELPADRPTWTFHDLQRNFASGCARLGIAPHVTEACLNHRSGSIRGVARTYNRHDYAAEKLQCLAGWGRHVEAIVSRQCAGQQCD